MFEKPPEPVYALILVYAFPLELPIISTDLERGLKSTRNPLHALTRIGRSSRPEWEEFKKKFGIPIFEYCVERLPLDISKDIGRIKTGSRTPQFLIDAPCVVARLDGPQNTFTHRIVIRKTSLESCKGDLVLFERALKELLLLQKFVPAILSPHPETRKKYRPLRGKKLA